MDLLKELRSFVVVLDQTGTNSYTMTQHHCIGTGVGFHNDHSHAREHANSLNRMERALEEGEEAKNGGSTHKKNSVGDSDGVILGNGFGFMLHPMLALAR